MICMCLMVTLWKQIKKKGFIGFFGRNYSSEEISYDAIFKRLCPHMSKS